LTGALANHDYTTAYSLLGPTFKATTSPAKFASGYATTQSVQAMASPTADPNTVHVDITATDSAPGGGSTQRQFSGSWHVVPAPGGGWLLDTAMINQVGPTVPVAAPTVPAAAPAAPPATGGSSHLLQASGTGDDDTANFFAPTGSLRVCAVVSGSSPGGRYGPEMSFTVYRADGKISGSPVDMNTTGCKTVHPDDGPGRYYLHIGATDWTHWTITVDAQ
jgi:hypothetical protein